MFVYRVRQGEQLGICHVANSNVERDDGPVGYSDPMGVWDLGHYDLIPRCFRRLRYDEHGGLGQLCSN